MTERLKIVDFLKGYSIFSIVLMHLLQDYSLPNAVYKALSFGGAGVHVFILCSGFGLYLSYLRTPTNYMEFLKKRFSRIYWPMAIVCLLTALWMIFQRKDVLWPLLGNLFLFKMFVPELENSMGGQMWFVSTIIQFYLAWPLILKLIRIKQGFLICCIISLLWATIVGLIGKGPERVWNSFFLQYLWEFCLGMKLAEIYIKNPTTLSVPNWKYLILCCVIGIIMTGVMGWAGFPWRLYNDLPSLVGYTSLALIIYKLGIVPINSFFSYTSKFSYEWYLVHILIFQILRYSFGAKFSVIIEWVVCLVLSYFVALLYSQVVHKLEKVYAKSQI